MVARAKAIDRLKAIGKPKIKPRPYFSSGPTAKPPTWTPKRWAEHLSIYPVYGRAHRSSLCRERMDILLLRMRNILAIPSDHRILLTPGSATGALETALWNLLGPRPVSVLVADKFSQAWADDISDHLRLEMVDIRRAYQPGWLPDLEGINPEHDCVFAWTGTPLGLTMPTDTILVQDRQGLVVCDATSAVFACPLPWDRLDGVSFSWQKALGGEAQHGVLVLSPKAVDRIGQMQDSSKRAIPRVLRLNPIRPSLGLAADPINTLSLLVIEDAHFCLDWIDDIGGAEVLYQRVADNYNRLLNWISNTDWIEFLVSNSDWRASTPVCLVLADDAGLSGCSDNDIISHMIARLDSEGVAWDIGHHASAPLGLRLWTGPTVEAKDVDLLTIWLDWAYSDALRVCAR